MDKYRQARTKLTDAQKSAMDSEYKQMANNGMTKFTSKITGLDYTVAENQAGKKQPEAQVAPQSVSKGNAWSNLTKGDPIASSKFSLNKPASMVYSDPEEQLKKPVSQSKIETKADNTRTDVKPQNIATEYEVAKMKADKQASPLRATLSNALRGLPFPTHVTSMLEHKLTNSSQFDRDSFTPEQRRIMYKMAEAAAKKTGKDSGSFSYDDYKDYVSADEYKEIQKLKNGGVQAGSGIMDGYSAGFNMAATMGSASFHRDKKSGKILITDDYDFLNKYTNNPDGSFNQNYLKDAKTPYQKLRRSLAIQDSETKKKTGGAPINPYSVDLVPGDTVQTAGDRKLSQIRTSTALAAGQQADKAYNGTMAAIDYSKEKSKDLQTKARSAVSAAQPVLAGAVKKGRSVLNQIVQNAKEVKDIGI